MFSKKTLAVLAGQLLTLSLSGASQAATIPVTHQYTLNFLNSGDQNSGSVTDLPTQGNVVIGLPITVALPGVPHSIDITKDGAHLYIAVTSPANGDGIVDVRASDHTIVAKIPLQSPSFVLVRPNDAQLYAATGNQVVTVNIGKNTDGSRKNVVVTTVGGAIELRKARRSGCRLHSE